MKIGIAAAILTLMITQTITAVSLINARHELRVLCSLVEEHDGMLEQVGDAVTLLEEGK